MADTGVRVRVGPGGWVQVFPADPTVEVQVRFRQTGRGRIAVAEVCIARNPGVTADSTRAVPIGRLEAWANGPGGAELRARIEDRKDQPDAELAAIDTEQRSAAPERAERGTGAEAQAGQDQMMRLAMKGTLKIRVPPGQPKPDSFYERFGKVYGQAAGATAKPAVQIAEANGVPVTTVHGWVKEARRRGLLVPGERQARESKR